MAYTHALSLVPRTFRSVPFVELRQSLPSQVAAISPFVDQLMRLRSTIHFDVCVRRYSVKRSGDAFLLFYSCGSVSSSSVLPVPSWSAGNGAPPSGTCAAGSLYSNNANSGTGLYVCSSIQMNSSETTVYQTWLPVL
jgi:hypothetical protein